MKKIYLSGCLVLFAAFSFAQKYDDIKGAIALGQTAKAKELLDKNGNEKFYSKPEGYMVKSAIFSSLSLDSSKAAQADANRETAFEAFQKTREMDPGLKAMEDPILKNGPFNLYASYFNAGVADINAKSYEPAYEKFKKVVNLSDVLIEKKILQFPTDTNALFYAGILAETTKHPEEALKYNTRLADLKVVGPNYESVYQSLVRYYAMKNDDANFEKYRALGKSLYPKSEFFTYNKLDFAIGASGSFDEKIANLEKIIASNPNDYTSQLALGEAVFDTLNSHKEGAVRPSNYDALEVKMLAALNKASSIKPDEMQPILLLGEHYMNKAEYIGDKMRPVETEVIKKGAKATPADKQKLAEIKKTYDAAYDLSRDNFEKAADMFGKKGTLDANQKRQYRIIVGNLAQYYSYKREGAKGAELNKVIATEKKYNDLYDQLRK